MTPQGLFDVRSGAVPKTYPNHFGWCPIEKAQLVKILIFRDNGEAISTRVFPDRTVVYLMQINVSDMR